MPDQYAFLIRNAKKQGDPFQVNELNYSDFYDLKSLSEEIGLNIAKNADGDQIKISDIKIVEFRKGHDHYKYKIKYDSEWILAPIRSGRSTSRTGRSNNQKLLKIKLKQAYTSKLIISGRKKDDLQKLLRTGIVPKYYETFYNNMFYVHFSFAGLFLFLRI